MSESVKPFSKLYDLTQRAEKVGISDDDVLREILVEKIVIAGERRLRSINYLQYPTTKAIVK